MLMMIGFGALALLQGVQVYTMQKQIQRQNDKILDSARRRTTTNQTETSESEQEEVKTPPAKQQRIPSFVNKLSAVDSPIP